MHIWLFVWGIIILMVGTWHLHYVITGRNLGAHIVFKGLLVGIGSAIGGIFMIVKSFME